MNRVVGLTPDRDWHLTQQGLFVAFCFAYPTNVLSRVIWKCNYVHGLRHSLRSPLRAVCKVLAGARAQGMRRVGASIDVMMGSMVAAMLLPLTRLQLQTPWRGASPCARWNRTGLHHDPGPGRASTGQAGPTQRRVHDPG